MGSTIMDGYTDIPRGTYRWYVGLYNDYWDRFLTYVDDSDKEIIFRVFHKLRDEHTINWSRNYLYEIKQEDIEKFKLLIENKIQSTNRFDVLKVCLYLLRNKNCIVDDYILRVVPEFKSFIENYTEPILSPLQKKVLYMARSEHSLRDLELLGIRNRDFNKLIARRAVECSGERYHTTNLNSIELNLTYDCNLKCYNCDRMCGKAESNEIMSIEQIEKFIEESKSYKKQWVRIGLTGGEPTLHPNIIEIVETILNYRNNYLPESSFIQIVSNGYKDALKVLKEIELRYTQNVVPSTVSNTLIRNNNKRNKVVLHSPVNMAPIDDDERKKSDFRNGCWVTETAGLSLSMHGYYYCGVAAAIDRVIGYDIGIKSLKNVNMSNIIKQREKLCAFCGRFNDLSISQEYYGPTWIIEEMISPTWKRAFDSYNKAKPSLTLY